MPRTNLLAGAAVGTFRIINVGTEIRNSDRLAWTGFFTFFTADASNIAGCSHSFSFVMGIAGYKGKLFIRNQFDQMSRTFCHTFSAGLTCLPVNNSNTLYYLNSVERTGLHTVSISQTAV